MPAGTRSCGGCGARYRCWCASSTATESDADARVGQRRGRPARRRSTALPARRRQPGCARRRCARWRPRWHSPDHAGERSELAHRRRGRRRGDRSTGAPNRRSACSAATIARSVRLAAASSSTVTLARGVSLGRHGEPPGRLGAPPARHHRRRRRARPRDGVRAWRAARPRRPRTRPHDHVRSRHRHCPSRGGYRSCRRLRPRRRSTSRRAAPW